MYLPHLRTRLEEKIKDYFYETHFKRSRPKNLVVLKVLINIIKAIFRMTYLKTP